MGNINIQNGNQYSENDADTLFRLGEKVIAKRLGWEGNGSTDNPLRRADVKGIITSIKGISPTHTSIYKYEFTWSGGRMYTNGTPHNCGDIQGLLIPESIF